MTETIKGSVVLLTGATGAIAKALIAELKARGAAKIYAAARDVSSLKASDGLVPIKMDVTNDEDVAKAAATAGDVTLLINNAGINHNTAFLVAPDIAIAREEIEINYLAPLRVTKAFAPVLIKNKGAVLNLLTILVAGQSAVHGFLLRIQGSRPQPDAGPARRTDAKGCARCRRTSRRHRYPHDGDVDHPEDDHRGCSQGNPRWIRGGRRRDLCRRDGAWTGSRPGPRSPRGSNGNSLPRLGRSVHQVQWLQNQRERS